METTVKVSRQRAMVDLKSVESATRALTSALRRALVSDERTARLRPPLRGNPDISNDETGGYWVELGRLDRSISVELWLDHYSGLATPRAWIGFRSASPEKLKRIARLAKRAGFRKPSITKTRSDISSTRPYRFRRPLCSDEMDVLVLEKYARWRCHFLGMYFHYSWPIRRHTRQAIVRDAINLIGGFTDVWAQSDREAKLSSPGPWARPNPATEASAVRYVKRFLRASGYAVRSRETEICGYDLHAVKEGSELHVEVKGSVGSFPRFFISNTEYKTSSLDPDWRLAVVLVGRAKPILHGLIDAATMRRVYKLAPIQWEARPSSRLDHKYRIS